MMNDFYPMQIDRGGIATNISPELFNRLLTTEEAAQATGLSQYELRKGAEEGRYPCILLGSPKNKFRKRRWNLEMLMAAIMSQGNRAGEGY